MQVLQTRVSSFRSYRLYHGSISLVKVWMNIDWLKAPQAHRSCQVRLQVARCVCFTEPTVWFSQNCRCLTKPLKMLLLLKSNPTVLSSYLKHWNEWVVPRFRLLLNRSANPDKSLFIFLQRNMKKFLLFFRHFLEQYQFYFIFFSRGHQNPRSNRERSALSYTPAPRKLFVSQTSGGNSNVSSFSIS